MHHAIAVPCVSQLKGWKRIVKYDLLFDKFHCLVDRGFHLMLLNLEGKIPCILNLNKHCAFWPRYRRNFDDTLIIRWVTLRGASSNGYIYPFMWLLVDTISINVGTCWEWMWIQLGKSQRGSIPFPDSVRTWRVCEDEEIFAVVEMISQWFTIECCLAPYLS